MSKVFRTVSRVPLYSLALLIVSGCAVTVVQPYDEKLLTETEAIFKKASAMIDDGVMKSPSTDEERKGLKALSLDTKAPKPLADNPAHASKFEARYNELATDSDALILRALSTSQEVGPLGNKLQKGIERLIEKNLPSACADLEAQFDAMTASLTVKNYVDLKCIIVRWKIQHNDPELTGGTGILKKVNWELRKSTIFGAAVAIEQAETSKKKK